MWAAVLLLSVAGCRPTLDDLKRPPTPQTPGQTLADLAAAERFPGTFRAVARIDISGERGAYPVKVAVLTAWPDALRVEHLPLLGPPDFFLALKGDRLQVFLPGEGAYWTGRATRGHLAPYLPVGLSGAELTALLRGTCPREDGLVPREGGSDPEDRQLDLSDAHGKRLSLWIDPRSRTLRRCTRFDARGAEVYTIRFDEHRSLAGRPWPMRIRFTAAAPPAVAMTIRYTEPELSPEADGDPFDLPVPPGVLPRSLPEAPP